jgi:hypothetical protein
LKISSHQVRAALNAYVKGKRQGMSPLPSHPSGSDGPMPFDGLANRLNELPEEREILVHDLRTQVRRGRYFVSGRDIVDALLGRLTADLLNQE